MEMGMSCLTLAAIGLHLASYHSDRPTRQDVVTEYNNVNPGLYVKSECGLMAGVYRNSIERTSVYLGYAYEPRGLPVFVSAAVSTGYYDTVTPIVMAGVKIGQFRIGYIPKFSKMNDTHVVHLMFERKF
jgi:hypothetical protein